MYPDALSKKITRSLSRGRHKELYLGIFIAHDDDDEPYLYYEFLRSVTGKDTLKELGQVESFNDVITVLISLSQTAINKNWHDLVFNFNSLVIEDTTLDYAKELDLDLHLSTDETKSISNALFDAGATTSLLHSTYFAKTDNYPSHTALDCIQNEKADFFTEIKNKDDATDPVYEVLNFVKKNNLTKISNSYEESLLCLISSIAYQYYGSEDALAKLIEMFGSKQVLMSRCDPIAKQIMQALEMNVKELYFDGLMLSGSRWLLRDSDTTNRATVINKDTDHLTDLAKDYLHYYIESQEKSKPHTFEEGESMAYMIRRLGEYGLEGNLSYLKEHEDLNVLNLNLIKEIIATYIDVNETPIEWFESFLKQVKQIAKYESEPIRDVAFSYGDIRDYILKLKPIEVDPMAHFNPLRIALRQGISSRERDASVASKLLATTSIDDVAKTLLYTDDVIAFIKYYDIDPVQAMQYIDDNELQAFCMSLVSK